MSSEEKTTFTLFREENSGELVPLSSGNVSALKEIAECYLRLSVTKYVTTLLEGVSEVSKDLVGKIMAEKLWKEIRSTAGFSKNIHELSLPKSPAITDKFVIQKVVGTDEPELSSLVNSVDEPSNYNPIESFILSNLFAGGRCSAMTLLEGAARSCNVSVSDAATVLARLEEQGLVHSVSNDVSLPHRPTGLDKYGNPKPEDYVSVKFFNNRILIVRNSYYINHGGDWTLCCYKTILDKKDLMSASIPLSEFQ